MNRHTVGLDGNAAEELRLVLEGLWDVYPEVELLAKVNSSWHETPRSSGRLTYFEKEWIAPFGTNDDRLYVKKNLETGAITMWFERW
jgi:hypothetical protein